MSTPDPTTPVTTLAPIARTSAGAHRRARTRRRHSARGFTLIEVLVAVVVISIGLLGVARLLLAAVKANDSAYFRSQAADLAYSILDAMRANRGYAMTSPGYTVALGQDETSPGFTCDASVCTPTQLAQYNLYKWKQQLAAALPSGDGAISFNPNSSGLPTATITVQWDDSIAAWAFGAPKGATDLTTFTLESAL